jgi:hypothetical protein
MWICGYVVAGQVADLLADIKKTMYLPTSDVYLAVYTSACLDMTSSALVSVCLYFCLSACKLACMSACLIVCLCFPVSLPACFARFACLPKLTNLKFVLSAHHTKIRSNWSVLRFSMETTCFCFVNKILCKTNIRFFLNETHSIVGNVETFTSLKRIYQIPVYVVTYLRLYNV